jgi:thiamine-monophosphate kinase
MVEGVHFRSSQLAPADIGYRAMTGAASDLAAMGADGGEALIALTVPPALGSDALLALVAAKFGEDE